MRVRTGPLTRKNGVSGRMPTSVASGNAGSLIASTAARTTGKYSGRHPAMTALAATPRTVAAPCRGGITATTASGSRSTVESIAATRSGVGGMTGSPSVQPLATAVEKKSADASSAEPTGTEIVPVMTPTVHRTMR